MPTWECPQGSSTVSLLICSHEASTRRRDQKGQALIWLSATCTCDQKQRSATHLSNKGLWKQDFWTLPFGKCTSSGSFWCTQIISSSSTSACAHLNMCACGHIHAFSISIYIYIYVCTYTICKPPILYTAISGLVDRSDWWACRSRRVMFYKAGFLLMSFNF